MANQRMAIFSTLLMLNFWTRFSFLWCNVLLGHVSFVLIIGFEADSVANSSAATESMAKCTNLIAIVLSFATIDAAAYHRLVYFCSISSTNIDVMCQFHSSLCQSC